MRTRSIFKVTRSTVSHGFLSQSIEQLNNFKKIKRQLIHYTNRDCLWHDKISPRVSNSTDACFIYFHFMHEPAQLEAHIPHVLSIKKTEFKDSSTQTLCTHTHTHTHVSTKTNQRNRGNLEGGSYTGDFERWTKEGSRNGACLSERALWGEPGRRAPLLGTSKDMLSKGLEMGVCFHRGPAFWGAWRDVSCLGPLREGKKFLYSGKFLWGIWEICKKKKSKRAALSIGALLGKLERVRLLGILREKENAYLGSSFLDPEDIKSQVWGASGTLARNRAPLSWYHIMRYKRFVYKA